MWKGDRMKTISGIEFASEHNGTDVFRLIELAYEQGQKDVLKQLPSAHGTNLADVGTDLISRQQAIDDIWTVSPLACLDRKWVDRWLRQLPSAQPDIIRCKDCKHWDTTWQNDYAPNYHYCPMIDGTHRNDFYCADAERRETTT